MDTHQHIDIDRHIEEMRAALRNAAGADERHWTEVTLDRLIAERDAAYAELRVDPDWDRLPF
jgi:hypothetical protein